jgi:hypothetical protein
VLKLLVTSLVTPVTGAGMPPPERDDWSYKQWLTAEVWSRMWSQQPGKPSCLPAKGAALYEPSVRVPAFVERASQLLSALCGKRKAPEAPSEEEDVETHLGMKRRDMGTGM